MNACRSGTNSVIGGKSPAWPAVGAFTALDELKSKDLLENGALFTLATYFRRWLSHVPEDKNYQTGRLSRAL